MWSSQCTLHRVGPDFKASPHPSTKCGQAAKVSVGEKLFTALFSKSLLSPRSTLHTPRSPLKTAERLFVWFGEKTLCLYRSLLRRTKWTCPRFVSPPPMFFFLSFFLDLPRHRCYSNPAKSHRVWLTFSSQLVLDYKFVFSSSHQTVFSPQIIHPP